MSTDDARTASSRTGEEDQMKVYIATGLKNTKRHNKLRDLLADRGIGLTYDWTFHGNVSDSGRDIRAETAEKEVVGAASSDAVVVLLPGGRGTHTELGIGLGHCVPVFLWEENGDFSTDHGTCVFYWHESVHRKSGSLEDLANYIAEYLLEPTPY